MKRIICLTVLPLIGLFVYHNVSGQGTTLTTREVVTDLAAPWEILWGPDNWIWITEKLNGQISRINPETGEKRLLYAITEVNSTASESGLLGMVLHPDFQNTPHVFAAYNYNNGTPYLKVVRFTYNAALDILENPQPLIEQIPTGSHHHGCRLLIIGDKLLITTGDAGIASRSQDDGSRNGKVLRYNLDGTIPDDNPIENNPLWTKGHRNAQGLIYVALHNKIYLSEHGGSGGSNGNGPDELNIIEKNENYGWPNVAGKAPLLKDFPLEAPAGIDFYNHAAIPEWQNSILMGNLYGENLIQFKLNASGDAVVSHTVYYDGDSGFGRIRDICAAPDGRVFICTSNKDQSVGSPGTGDDKIIEIKNAAYVPELSDQKSILAFRFLAALNPGLSADINGELLENENPKRVNVLIPAEDQVNLSSLIPSIVISEEAQISPASEVANNFTSPVTYTVTAEDNSTQQYIVTVGTITGEEDGISNNVDVYPNPFTKTIQLSGLQEQSGFNVRLFSSTGYRVSCSFFEDESGNLILRTEHLRPGAYFLQIELASGVLITKRVMKVN